MNVFATSSFFSQSDHSQSHSEYTTQRETTGFTYLAVIVVKDEDDEIMFWTDANTQQDHEMEKMESGRANER